MDKTGLTIKRMSFKLVFGVMFYSVFCIVIFLIAFAYFEPTAVFLLVLAIITIGLLILVKNLYKVKIENVEHLFREFKETLNSEISSYKIFSSGHPDYWQPTNEQGVKNFIEKKHYSGSPSPPPYSRSIPPNF